MTDDEIDAILRPMLAKHYGLAESWVRDAHEIERIAYRAGMLRAALIARERLLPFTDYDCGDSYNMGIDRAADAIEHAASETPAA